MTQTESSPERRQVSTRLSALVILLAITVCGAVAWYFLYDPNAGVSGEGTRAGVGPAARRTTLHTATLDVGDTPNALRLRYLDVPWGPVTFGHMEKGDDQYYSQRTWPFAHLQLGVKAVYEGKELAPGDYVLIFTPKGKEPEMSLSIASFKPESSDSTFLVAGDVQTPTPADAVVIHKKPIAFAQVEPVAKALHFDLAKVDGGAEIRLHYGDRMLTERLSIP
jgi:hypothetical protein